MAGVGVPSLVNSLCEIAFIREVDRGCDIYRRPPYTKRRRKILKCCAWERLFEELRAPWVEIQQGKTAGLNVYDELSVRAFELRLSRKFDDADRLDHFVAQWKHLKGA